MGKVKKIALIISASNFERQKRVVCEVHEALRDLGDYALYVFTSYGIFISDISYNIGARSIYQLALQHDFDGCIMESNIGNMEMFRSFAQKLKEHNTPLVMLNGILENEPFAILNAYSAQEKLMEHLIHGHQCRKINFVGFAAEDIFTKQAIQGYRDTLEKNGISYEERRVVRKPVSIENGRKLYDVFKENGIDDAQATICMHDVHAIGFCLELKKRGLSVPEDMRLCSMNYSSNSMGFRPSITGIGRQDESISRKACVLLRDMLEGKKIRKENYFEGKIYFGQSCGCCQESRKYEDELYQKIILNKIEAGNQISLMMNYNDSLEKVESLQELGDNIFDMLQGGEEREFIFCLNKRDVGYILNEEDDFGVNEQKPFDDTMVALTGNHKEIGRITDISFPISKLLPVSPQAGDLYILMPVHRNDRVFGYVTFINNYNPIEVYNHRILHESIGNSIESLRRQMILRSSIRELDELHMRDALTGLYNRYAQERYVNEFIDSGSYAVVMIDMDGLKEINDTYGHLAGNNALNIMADALRDCVHASDLLVRYAGDEFLILSYTIDQVYWDTFSERLNYIMVNYSEKQKLPYRIGASVGYDICNQKTYGDFVNCYKKADYNMYINKQARKQARS